MTPPDPRQALFVLALLSVPGVVIYARMLRRVRERGGRVETAAFGLTELLLSFFYFGLFAIGTLLMGKKGGELARTPTSEDHLGGMVMLGLFGLLPLAFLAARGVSLTTLFGLRRQPWLRALWHSVLLIAAAFPICSAVGFAAAVLLGESARQQDVVVLYQNVAQGGPGPSLWLLIISAAIFHPIVEEVIFRGYLYAVFKGWAGAAASAFSTALLFGLVHGSLTHILPLTCLALLLTLAYEWSGSLLVPVSMHAVFNSVQLALLTWGGEWVKS
jgi:membrane protease YdiL (CAAX protease family)